MEYRDVEGRLAELHRVGDEGMGAFRARLRVLRTMGVPDLPKVGKGARVTFSSDHVAELHLALTMGELGLPPMRIVQAAHHIRKLADWPRRCRAGEWLVLSVRGDLEFRDAPVTPAIGDGLLRVHIVSDAELLVHIRTPKLNAVATWHAVLDLGRIADDLRVLA